MDLGSSAYKVVLHSVNPNRVRSWERCPDFKYHDAASDMSNGLAGLNCGTNTFLVRPMLILDHSGSGIHKSLSFIYLFFYLRLAKEKGQLYRYSVG